MIDKKWTIYIAKCNDGTFYTGISTEVSRRIMEHNQSHRSARYTRTRRPISLYWEYPLKITQSQAIRGELMIKSWTHLQKKNIINLNLPNLTCQIFKS